MSVDTQFNIINEKLQLLLKQMNRLKKENEHLKFELENQKKEKENAENNLEELHQQIAILKLVTGQMSDKDKKDFERNINLYIKEIDKCISYLGQ
jgi:predicted RNase H-like nuclease (RuvC/YqgF family)